MTAFTDAVAARCKHPVAIGELSHEFSATPCDSCGCRLGGSRYGAVGAPGHELEFTMSVCEDCALYHANGDEPDGWVQS